MNWASFAAHVCIMAYLTLLICYYVTSTAQLITRRVMGDQ